VRRTRIDCGMAELGQIPPPRAVGGMSVIPPKAAVMGKSSFGRFVPRGDLSRCTKYRQLLDHLIGAQLEGAARAPNALVSSIWPRLDERVCLVLPPLKMALKPPQLH
jgi:hypothetical protein